VGNQIVSTFFLYWQQGDALRGVALQSKGSQRLARTYWCFALAVCRFLHLNWPSRCEGYRDLFMSRRFSLRRVAGILGRSALSADALSYVCYVERKEM
jgi:hypothetical protein